MMKFMKPLTKASLIVCLLTLIAAALMGCSITEGEARTFRVPEEEIPVFELPSLDNAYSTTVFTNYEANIIGSDEAGAEQTLFISLPAIRPDLEYAEAFNQDMRGYWEQIVQDIDYSIEEKLPFFYRHVDYETYEDSEEGLLSVLVTMELLSGETAFYTATFDTVAKEKLTTPDLAKRLLNMDYPSFLMLSNEIVMEDFRNRYHDEVYPASMEADASQQKDKQEAYEGSLVSIPIDTYNLYFRSLCLLEGKVMLIYEGIELTEDWWYGLESTSRITELHEDWGPENYVPEKSMGNLLALQVSGRRYYPEFFSYILQDAFLNDPHMFIQILSQSGEAEQIASHLIYACDIDTREEIRSICTRMIRCNGLSDSESKVAAVIIKEFS